MVRFALTRNGPVMYMAVQGTGVKTSGRGGIMKGLRALGVSAALLVVLACGLLSSPPLSAAADKPALAQEDCVKCHEAPPADIAAAGSKHKSEVGCLDCHAGHRPASKNNIPQCGQCHEGKPHYKEKNCLSCHRNPHKPLNVAFGSKVTEPCLSCHTDQIKQLRDHKSKHTSLFCSNCHDVHRKVPECVKCHKPHTAAMAQADCGKCHKAHQPTTLAYGPDVPNKDCAACHKKAFDLLSATATKHKDVACVKCHANKHKTVPACAQCHGQKHPAQIMKKFPACGTCHSIAHDLNNWAAAGAADKAKPGAVPAPKKKR